MNVTRREFFIKTIPGATLLALPITLGPFLESCNDQGTNPTNPGSTLQTINAALANGSVVINIDSSSPLANTGAAAIVNYQSGSVLVDHPASSTFNAISPICTHQGCGINNFDSKTSQFVCLCHGSRFSVDGQVAQGPASAGLHKYQTTFSNNQLTIKIV
ncbi:MAG: Rieske (2Fe-2S) protein [Ignavibacteriales bacterium]|nr:Rieske (2Fe-2S) protein [Ignavibacteriales bacterium]